MTGGAAQQLKKKEAVAAWRRNWKKKNIGDCNVKEKATFGFVLFKFYFFSLSIIMAMLG